MRLYLDTCCLNRPWDDQSQVQVHLEAEAVLYMIEEARIGRLQLVSSDYLFAEIEGIKDPQRKTDVLNLTLPVTLYVSQSHEIETRAAEFAPYNIVGYDSLHIAAAEAAKVDYLLTTDQSLLRRSQRANNFIRVTLINPINWPPTDRAP